MPSSLQKLSPKKKKILFSKLRNFVDEEYTVMSNPRKIYWEMLKDISKAKKSIYLENYVYRDDKIGREFRDALVRKAKQGVKIYVLLDAWSGGFGVNKKFFKNLINAGGNVRFFREIKYTFRMLSKNHERDHRKMLVIDRKIIYVGSINFTHDFIDWRELVLRIESEGLAYLFVRAFSGSWKSAGGITKKRVFSFIHEEYMILQDIPSLVRKYTEKTYIKLINHAKKEIDIETPYFVPSFRIRKALLRAVKRKVKVRIILPLRSNWRIIDITRNRYLGILYKGGVDIYYYKPTNLHSKLLLVDNNFFLLGSSNVDYRSFRHNFELNLLGKNPKIVNSLRVYFIETLKDSILFDYNDWKNRSSIIKIYELLLSKIRKLL